MAKTYSTTAKQHSEQPGWFKQLSTRKQPKEWWEKSSSLEFGILQIETISIPTQSILNINLEEKEINTLIFWNKKSFPSLKMIGSREGPRASMELEAAAWEDSSAAMQDTLDHTSSPLLSAWAPASGGITKILIEQSSPPTNSSQDPSFI